MAKTTNAKKNNIKDRWLEENKQEDVNWSKTLSKIANSKIEESLKDFSKLSEKERKEYFWDKEFFEQFREFFKEKHPKLLDEIWNLDNLKIYLENLKNMWFSLKNIMNKTKDLHREFKETLDEKTTITKNLKDLKVFCENSDNKMPIWIFNNFANEIWLKTTPNIEITPDTKITKIWEISKLRKKFLEDNDIKLKDYQKDEIQNFLSPNYLPTERLLISATIKKIRKNLPEELHWDFDIEFPTPINIHSRFQNLKDLKQLRTIFLEWKKSIIDETLAKKLDKIIISNWDIYKEFQYEWEDINRSKWFSDQTKNFRNMFNQLATRQLFEESKEKWTYIEHHLQQVGNEFKAFPPYFNEILNIYPYNHEKVINQQSTHKTEYTKQSETLAEKEKELEKTDISEEQKETIRKEIFEIKDKLNETKRKAYADYIKTQDKDLGNIISTLVDSRFDISKLSKENQQKILDTLVNSKLWDSIKNKIPNILWIDNNEYEKFIKNLFDLNQKEITIPTNQYWEIPIQFLEKSFLWWPTKDLFDIWSWNKSLSEQKNLPLNLRIKISEQNKDFFEDNIIFEEFFNTFNSKNWPIKINDNYKVVIRNKEWKPVEWYLSKIPPKQNQEDDETISKQKDWWFLYSKPVTRPEDDREIVTRNWDSNWDPVVILANKENENNYELDVISKEINLNWEWISGLLFSHVLWKYNENNSLSREQEKKINQQFWKLPWANIYKDTIDNYMHLMKDENKNEKKDIEKEISEKEKNKKEFLEERRDLWWYQEKDYEKGEKEKTYGFKKWAKLLIKWPESWFHPTGVYQYITAEVKEIKNDKFKLKFTWSEVSLWKYEWFEPEFNINKDSIKKIKDTFEDGVYKLPDNTTCQNITNLLPAMESASIDSINPSESFKGTNRDGNKFNISIGKEESKPVSYFGIVEAKPGEDWWQESKTAYMYKIEHDSNKKRFKITWNDDKKTVIYLDYPNFILFISSRKLQPQTEESAKAINIQKSDWPDLKEPKKRKWYGFASIIGLFKNFGKKIWDWLKKYEEEQVEDLTDNIFYHWKLFHTLSWIMPTAKLKEAFWNAGDEYMTERDNKTWKKIEKYQKFFESDPDFGWKYMREKNIKPYLSGEKKFKDNHQAAAMLLVIIKKWKWPYSRNTDRAGKWMRVSALFWEAHQARYLTMKEKLERELQQWYKTHGQMWADDLQNEILKLEMKYITHCIDWRQLRVGDDDVARLESMYSKTFAWKLEEESNKFFSESVSWSSKEKSYSFELARFEYFRLLWDRPQQAIPCLKQMACKAVTPTQWKIFESAVLTWMLSWVFYNVTQEDKSFIQKICRTIWFLPWMRIKDPNHHYKVEKFIKIVTNQDIEWYQSNKFWFWKWENLSQYKNIASYEKWLNVRFTSNWRLEKISKFAAMEGKNHQWKTLIELLNDPTTPIETKEILSEIEARSLEKDETLDSDVKTNWYGLEQNILAKNQSFIWEITDFQNWEFKAKDKDEKQWIQTARQKITKSIPKSKLNDENQVIYILKKFMNRFEQRGFNVEWKRFLIRSLKTIKEEENKWNTEWLEEMLWYLIVGNVVESSGNHQPPNDLISWLEAFKEFFKNNKDTILKSNVVEQGIGNIFVSELDKKPLKLAPWDEYIDIAKNKFVMWENAQERKRRSDKQKLYRWNNLYINEEIYKLATNIERKNHIPNMFDKYFSLEKKKTTSQKLQEALDPKTTVKLKNSEIIEKALRKTSWNSDQNYDIDEETMAEIAESEEWWYDNFY